MPELAKLERRKTMGRNNQLFWYATSNSLWTLAFSVQTLMVTWVLVGILHESPERVGLAQLMIGVPGLLVILWGGVIGDKVDGRQLLLLTQLLCIVPALLLAAVSHAGHLGYWVLVSTALIASLLNAVSSPVRNTILNHLATDRLQQAIALTTAIAFIATIIGTRIGGEIQNLGLETVLYVQAIVLATSSLVTLKLQAAPPAVTQDEPGRNALGEIADGFRHIWSFPLARDVIVLNTLSSFFNAGAWMVAVPFIVTRVYAGDAIFLANLTIVFTMGSIASNFLMMKFMPLLHPGRLWLIMQLTRILILLAIWIKPDAWVFFLAAAFWGANMGVTMTTSRTMIQELPSARYRSRVMSVFTVGMMSASPIGSLLLGLVIGFWGPLSGLVPGILASVGIFVWGYTSQHIWQYESGK